MGLFSLEKLFGITIRESATDGSDFTNPDADYRRLFLGEDGQLHVKDSAGSVTDIGGGAATPPDAYQAFLTSPVTMTNADTFYDGPTLSLPAGDWMIFATADCSSAHASATFHTTQIYDSTGAVVLAATGAYNTAGAGGSSHCSAMARVTLGTTSTIKLRCASVRGSSDSVILDLATANGTADKCTVLHAIKVTSV
jgi:hypothetical protein